ncbi:unnamed protein product [marine sediment metagenome]|uniref:Uncharacterized protein n=1 Tax=marine sediment metagenome TaxID=412755 RepID=X1IN01_9ZZZZ
MEDRAISGYSQASTARKQKRPGATKTIDDAMQNDMAEEADAGPWI